MAWYYAGKWGTGGILGPPSDISWDEDLRYWESWDNGTAMSSQYWMQKTGLVGIPTLPAIYDQSSSDVQGIYCDDPFTDLCRITLNDPPYIVFMNYDCANCKLGKAYGKTLSYTKFMYVYGCTALPSTFRWGLLGGRASIQRMRSRNSLIEQNTSYRVWVASQTGGPCTSIQSLPNYKAIMGTSGNDLINQNFFTYNKEADLPLPSLNVSSGVVTLADGTRYLSNKGRPTLKRKIW